MPEFRKKPVVIEAHKYVHMEHDGDGPFPVFATDPTGWLTEGMEKSEEAEGAVFWDSEGLKIRTLEGIHLACPGDFIIRGVNGEIYPCKPDIFAATYDKADAYTVEAELLAALQGVVRIADRKTVEFDRAHAAIARAHEVLTSPARKPKGDRMAVGE